MGRSAGSAQRQKSSELPLEASLKSFPQQPQCPFHRWSRHRGQVWGLGSCLLIPCLGHLFFNFYGPTPPPFLLPLFSAKMSPPQALPLALLWRETSRLKCERQGLAKEDWKALGCKLQSMHRTNVGETGAA